MVGEWIERLNERMWLRYGASEGCEVEREMVAVVAAAERAAGEGHPTYLRAALDSLKAALADGRESEQAE